MLQTDSLQHASEEEFQYLSLYHLQISAMTQGVKKNNKNINGHFEFSKPLHVKLCGFILYFSLGDEKHTSSAHHLNDCKSYLEFKIKSV